IEKRDFDLWPVIEGLIQDLRPLTEPKRISVRNQVPPSCSVFADPVLITRVFQNLLSNSIEYTLDGEITIGSVISHPDRSVHCWVRDSGEGIPEERIGKVFDKLETDPHKTGGLGLGLAIVKQVVEAHGGCIRVASKSGEGASFEFNLPLQDADGVPNPMRKDTAA
ncbi:MAG TPA: HAMP domain-containing sensor histidine kinase, partial [Nitrososphaera sp.]|nr:HAMP domain-containing sensor histidine kinase [Nitrososphaera sp.]